MMTVGTGAFTYQLVRDWAKLPPGETFSIVSAVATETRDKGVDKYVRQR